MAQFGSQENNYQMTASYGMLMFIEQILIDTLLEVKQDAVMTIYTSRVEIGDFFGTDENRRIVKYGKDLPLENRTGEYVDICVIGKSFLITLEGIAGGGFAIQ